MNTKLFIDVLQDNYANIKAEFLSAVSDEGYSKWPEEFLYNKGWNVFGLRFQGNDIPEAHQLCPQISGLIKKYSDLIDTLGFSYLSPGTVIYPHVGYTDKVLRCHLGITVPEGDCCLRVGSDLIKWEEGVAFVFDDTIEHEAWNRTDEKRIVMLMDLHKDVLSDPEYSIERIGQMN